MLYYNCFQELYKEKKESSTKKVDIDLKYNGENKDQFPIK